MVCFVLQRRRRRFCFAPLSPSFCVFAPPYAVVVVFAPLSPSFFDLHRRRRLFDLHHRRRRFVFASPSPSFCFCTAVAVVFDLRRRRPRFLFLHRRRRLFFQNVFSTAVAVVFCFARLLPSFCVAQLVAVILCCTAVSPSPSFVFLHRRRRLCVFASPSPSFFVLRCNLSQKGASWVKWLGIVVVVGASLSVFSTTFASLHLPLQVCLSLHGTVEPPISQHVFAHVNSSLRFFS